MAHALMQPVFAMELAKTPESIPTAYMCAVVQFRALKAANTSLG